MDPDEALNALAALRLDVSQLSDRLNTLRIDPDDIPALAKFAQIQANLSNLARQMHSLPMDADTTGLTAKVLAAEVQVENLAKKLGPSNLIINPDDMPAAHEFAELYAQAQNLGDKLEDIQMGIDPADLAKVQTELAAVKEEMDSLSRGTSFQNLGGSFMPAYLQGLDAEVKKVSADLAQMPKSVDVASANTAFETMEERLANVDEYLKKTGDDGTESYHTLSAAIGDVNERLSVLKNTGIGPDQVGAVRTLDSAIKQLASDTGLAAVDANTAYQGFGIFGRAIAAIKNTSIPLFGGALEGLAPKFIADASGIHLIVEAVVELVAVWGPALLGLTAFGALAYQTAKNIYTQFTNMNTVATATGAKFAALKSGLQDLENAVKPEVMQLFGDYLMISANAGDHFATVMQAVGRVLDDFGTDIVNALNSQKTSTFLDKAAGDVHGLGVAFQDIGRIIGTALQAVPGYAEMLLKFGDAFLGIAANAVGALEPVLALFLKIHGAIFYLGLATTAVLAFGKAFAAGAIAKGAAEGIESLGSFSETASKWAADFTSDNDKVAESAGATGSKLQGLGLAVGNLTGSLVASGRGVASWVSETGGLVSEFGLADTAGLRFTEMLNKIPGVTTDAEGGVSLLGKAVAGSIGDFSLAAVGLTAFAAVLGVLVYEATRNETTAAQKLHEQLEALISTSNISDVQENIATAIAATTKEISNESAEMQRLTGSTKATSQSLTQIGPAAINPVTGGFSALGQKVAETNTQLNQNQDYLKQYIGQSITAGQRTGELAATYGGMNNALNLVNLAGVKQSDIVNAGSSAWARDEEQIAATAKAYGFMGQQMGAAGNQLDTLDIASGTTTKALQTLTQAESAWITMLTSGDSAFSTFEQGQTTLTDELKSGSAAGVKLTTTAGKLTEQQKLLGTSMIGTSTSALAARQAFDAQLSAGVTLYGNLQTLAAASGNTASAQKSLASSGKDIVAQMLPMAAGSKEATAELYGLAQVAGYTGPDSFKALTQWVGNAKNAESDLDTQQGKLTVSSANLTTAAKNLGNAVNQDIVTMESAAIVKTANFQSAVNGLATAMNNSHGAVTTASVSLAGEYVTALKAAGVSSSNAKDDLNAYLKQLGYTPTAISEIDGALGKSTSAWQGYDAQVVQNTAAAKNFKVATAANQTALDAIPGSLEANSKAYEALWTAVTKQDAATVKSGNDASGAKAEFAAFAHDGLGVTTTAANALWAKFGNQNLDTMASKATGTKTAFINLAEKGLDLTSSQANGLWREFALQNLDEMVSKGDGMKAAFIQLAEKGLGYTATQANSLWGTLKNQYLDTLAGKANETKAAFVKVAEQLGDTATQATNLWNKLHEVAGNYNAKVNVNVSGGGKITASVVVSSPTQTSQITNTPAASTSAQTNTSGKPLAGLYAGGVVPMGVPGYAVGGKVPGWHNGGDNMIAGLAGGGHVALQGGEAVVPKNLATHPAFTSFAKYHGIPGYAGGGLLEGTASYTQAPTTGSSLAALAEPALAQKIGNQTASVLSSSLYASLKAAQEAANTMNVSGPLGPATAGTVANGAAIFKYLMAFAHMTPIAAAGAIASIYGESAWNPLAAGTGGRGLIGWTPPGTISDAAYTGGLSTQLPQILRFISTSGDWGVISEMNKATSVFQAANEWGKGVERYGINDVHAEGIALAQGILNAYTKGGAQIVNGTVNGGVTAGTGSGIVANGYSYAQGGRVRPYSTGGTINEPVSGVGSYSGLPYSFGESGPEIVSNAGQAAAAGNSGMQGATNIGQQTLINQNNAILKALQQLPNTLGKAIGASGRSGVQHGFYKSQN